MITSNELKFAEKVMLIDASYINKVTTDLSDHFSQVVGRKLSKADLPLFLECVAMDAGIQPGENVLQVLFVYDKQQVKMSAFNPGDLKKELNDVAFKSQLGEFQLNTFEPSGMADKASFFIESVKLIADAKEVKQLIVIPSEDECDDRLFEIFKKVDGKESIHLFGMNPSSQEGKFSWETMGFAILQSLGVRADEIK